MRRCGLNPTTQDLRLALALGIAALGGCSSESDPEAEPLASPVVTVGGQRLVIHESRGSVGSMDGSTGHGFVQLEAMNVGDCRETNDFMAVFVVVEFPDVTALPLGQAIDLQSQSLPFALYFGLQDGAAPACTGTAGDCGVACAGTQTVGGSIRFDQLSTENASGALELEVTGDLPWALSWMGGSQRCLAVGSSLTVSWPAFKAPEQQAASCGL
jgi:hypothetical protein